MKRAPNGEVREFSSDKPDIYEMCFKLNERTKIYTKSSFFISSEVELSDLELFIFLYTNGIQHDPKSPNFNCREYASG